MKGTDCEVTGTGTTFIIKIDYNIAANTQFEFRIGNAIKNPISEKPSDIFKIFTSEDELDSDAQGMRVVAERGSMFKFTMSPESEVVGASTELTVRFRTQHLFPKGGYIRMLFPKWNPGQPNASLRAPYIQGSEACGAMENLSEDLFCNFKDDVLTIGRAAKANKQSNKELAFSVKGFKNPITGDDAYGFILQTAIFSGESFYVIDEKEASVVANQFATLSSPKLSVIENGSNDEKAGMI